MRSLAPLASAVIMLSSSCAAQTAVQQARGAPAQASTNCEPQAPGALVARPPHVKTKPSGHTVVASTFRFASARFVQGPCASEIVLFNVGEAFLSSTERLVIQENGSVKYYPRYPLPEKEDVSFNSIEDMPGYELVMAERILTSPTPGGGQAHIGLFRGESDDVIARFDLLNGKPSRGVERLLRSQSSIVSFDYLPSPDTQGGRIGLVQRAGEDKAWLYTYDWDYRRLRPLTF